MEEVSSGTEEREGCRCLWRMEVVEVQRDREVVWEVMVDVGTRGIGGSYERGSRTPKRATVEDENGERNQPGSVDGRLERRVQRGGRRKR